MLLTPNYSNSFADCVSQHARHIFCSGVTRTRMFSSLPSFGVFLAKHITSLPQVQFTTDYYKMSIVFFSFFIFCKCLFKFSIIAMIRKHFIFPNLFFIYLRCFLSNVLRYIIQEIIFLNHKKSSLIITS